MPDALRKSDAVKKVIAFFSAAVLFGANAWGMPSEAKDIPLTELYLQGKYEEVVSRTCGLSDMRRSNEEAVYLRSLSLLKLKRPDEAGAGFEYIISKYPRGRRVFDSYVGLSDSYFFRGDVDGAIGRYHDILKRFSQEENLAAVYYRLGSCYTSKDMSEEAAWCYKRIAELYPLSFEARLSPAPRPCVSRRGTRYFIQVGAFKDTDNAEKLRRRLSRQGYEADIKDEGALHKVWVGSAASRDAANDLASRLRRSGYNTKICHEER